MAKTVSVLLADGCEPLEVVAPVDILRRGGVNVMLVSLKDSLQVAAAHNITLVADAPIAMVDLSASDLLMIPGGSVGVENIGLSKAATTEIARRMEADEPIAAICAGPTVLGDMGLLTGRKAVCYPTCEEGWPEGVYQPGKPVEVDNNLITATGPGIAIPFGLAILKFLEGEKTANQVAEAHAGEVAPVGPYFPQQSL